MFSRRRLSARRRSSRAPRSQVTFNRPCLNIFLMVVPSLSWQFNTICNCFFRHTQTDNEANVLRSGRDCATEFTRFIHAIHSRDSRTSPVQRISVGFRLTKQKPSSGISSFDAVGAPPRRIIWDHSSLGFPSLFRRGRGRWQDPARGNLEL